MNDQNPYHDDPDSPAVYIAQSRTPVSLRALKAPLSAAKALNPPPDPIIAIVGTCINNKDKY